MAIFDGIIKQIIMVGMRTMLLFAVFLIIAFAVSNVLKKMFGIKHFKRDGWKFSVVREDESSTKDSDKTS